MFIDLISANFLCSLHGTLQFDGICDINRTIITRVLEVNIIQVLFKYVGRDAFDLMNNPFNKRV